MKLRIVALGAIFLSLFFYSFSTAHEDCSNTLGLLKPQQAGLAPDFTLRDLEGKKVSLKDFRGKLVFINFWATWCPACVEEMPSIEALHKIFGRQGLVVLAISLDVRKGPVQEFVKKFGLTFKILLDPRNQVNIEYGVRGLPASFILDGKGNFLYLALGARDWDSECARHLFSEILTGKNL